MCPVPARSLPRPDSVGLCPNDNGCKRVIKHKNDVPQASISHVPQRFTGVWYGGWHISSVSSLNFTSSTWKIILHPCPPCQILQLLTCFLYFNFPCCWCSHSVLHLHIQWTIGAFNMVSNICLDPKKMIQAEYFHFHLREGTRKLYLRLSLALCQKKTTVLDK